MKSGIYLIQNKVNGKVYVGSAVNIQKRWREHKRVLRKGKHHSQRLQRSWNKHGEENFQFIVIEHCEPENLIKLEQFMLDLLCSYEDDKGYNICATAGSTLGRKHSKKSKRKISEAAKGRTHSEESKRKMSEARKGEKNHRYGKPRSEETKRKIGEAQKGRTHSEETKRKMSEARKGEKNHRYGKTFSEETKRKMREARNAKGYSYEKASGKYMAKISINGKQKYLGRYDTPEEARAAYLAALDKVQQKPSGTLTESK